MLVKDYGLWRSGNVEFCSMSCFIALQASAPLPPFPTLSPIFLLFIPHISLFFVPSLLPCTPEELL